MQRRSGSAMQFADTTKRTRTDGNARTNANEHTRGERATHAVPGFAEIRFCRPNDGQKVKKKKLNEHTTTATADRRRGRLERGKTRRGYERKTTRADGRPARAIAFDDGVGNDSASSFSPPGRLAARRGATDRATWRTRSRRRGGPAGWPAKTPATAVTFGGTAVYLGAGRSGYRGPGPVTDVVDDRWSERERSPTTNDRDDQNAVVPNGGGRRGAGHSVVHSVFSEKITENVTG